MNPIDLIEKKRDGGELTEVELAFLINGYVQDRIPDYQISAFLMAVYFQGMTTAETALLTALMRDSGIVLDHSSISAFKVDKHSTGGVGDKVSLVLGPLLACAGLYVPMISGRALAHTGGTLDKLEAIPGFQTNMSMSNLARQLKETGLVLVGQGADLTPADKKIYALRDATATVHSIPLITASILSKKLAEGVDALVLDVKAGSGAIFQDTEKAWELAQTLVQTATQFGLKSSAIITAMTQPLGQAVGNWLETREAIETLQGGGPDDFRDLTLVLSGQALLHAGKTATLSEAIHLLQEKLACGAAFDKFVEIVKWQGGDAAVVEKPDSYPQANFSLTIKSDKNGFVSELRAREIGVVSMSLGAGRRTMADDIDYTAGIILHKKVGDAIQKGGCIATAYSNNETGLMENEQRLQNACLVKIEATPRPELIYGAVEPDGKKFWDGAKQEFRETKPDNS